MAAAAAPKPTRKEIAPNVTLYTTRYEDPTAFVYQVECAKFKKIVFEIDFEGSENFQLDAGGLKQETVVNPYEKKVVARLTLRNPRGAWGLRCRYKWLEGEPDRAVVEAIVEKDMSTIGRLVEAAHSMDFGADSALLRDLEKKCKTADVNFVDVEFPPSTGAIKNGGSDESKGAEGSETKVAEKAITWRRPVDFFDGEYDIFLHSGDAGETPVEPRDIRQGGLGDCWLMCALAALAERPEEVYQLFVSDDGSDEIQHANAAGVYKVRVCKNGEWQFVRIDDYFPCAPEAGPVFSKSHGNELWVLLVEKAMAKLCGSYERLKGGWAYEALMDLTGAPAFSYRLEDDAIQAEIKDGSFWKKLLKWDELGYMMSCSTPGEDKWSEGGGHPQGGPGLVSGHAYTLLEVKEHKEHKLLHIRNPWGSFEWNGNWSDNSPLWTDEIKRALGVTLSANDGAFWMDFEDFLRFFRGVNVCMLRADHRRWKEARKKGTFTFNRGKVTSTMYILSVTEKSTTFLGVHQEDERVATAKPYLDLGVTILQESDSGYKLIGSSGVEVARQAQLEVTLEPGEYYVVPHTTGCKFAQHAGKAPDTPVRVYDSETGEFTPLAEAALREIFRRLDEDMDGLLDRTELNSFSQMAEGCDMTEEVYKWLVQNFDSREGGITADGFVNCYYYMFQAGDEDPNVLWRDLRYMGYDNNLDLAGARTFVLSVHSDSEVGLWKVPFDAELFEEAVELPVKEKGTVTDFDSGSLKLHTLKAGYWGMTLACQNCSTERDVTFTLDCSRSTNVISHTGSLVCEQLIPAGQTEILHHLMPENMGAWSFGYRASWRWSS